MSPLVVPASALLAGLDPAEAAESRAGIRLAAIEADTAVRLRARLERSRAFARYVSRVDALAAELDAAVERDASRRDRLEDLELADAEVARCPVDGAWLAHGQPCRCCSLLRSRAAIA